MKSQTAVASRDFIFVCIFCFFGYKLDNDYHQLEKYALSDFSYLGGVLQRYEDKYGGPDIKNTRALAIALLECKYMPNTNMFIANQYV